MLNSIQAVHSLANEGRPEETEEEVEGGKYQEGDK